MRKYFSLGVLIVTMAAFSAVFSFAGQAHADTTITSGVSTNTTWSPSGGTYIIQGVISVDSGVTLTIDPGTIIKFDSGAGLFISGTLDAEGTSGSKIYFTSLNDDTVGGDTNGDSASTTPAANDWASIYTNSGASTTINHAVIRYGGSGICCANIYADVNNAGGILDISNSEIASSSASYYNVYSSSGTTTINAVDVHGSAYGIYMTGGIVNVASSTIHNNSSYGIYTSSPTGNLTLTDNTFSNNTSGSAYLDFSNGLEFTHSGNTTSGTGNKGLYVTGSIANNQVLTTDNIPYVISGILTVSSGKTLTINPGAVVKFDTGAGILVNGTLSAEGLEYGHIFFTSLKDDLIGGDTNGDSSFTTPSANDWATIYVSSGASTTINHAVIRYGGNTICCSGVYANVYNGGGTLDIGSSTIAYSNQDGIRMSAGTTTVVASDIGYNTYGVYVTGGKITISATSTLHNNTTSIYNGTGATSSAIATGNYWGDPAGPYNATYNPAGTTTSEVSDYVDFDPWVGKGSATTTLHYLVNIPNQSICPVDVGTSTPCASVHNNEILLDTTDVTNPVYLAELSGATSTWNAFGTVSISATTSTSSANVKVSAFDFGDIGEKGRWVPNYPITPDLIKLNTYYLDNNTTAQRKNTMIHELGHALGLNHSYTGNVMYFAQSSQATLGIQDIADFNYLWP